jgi:hypothetical protein
MNPRTESNQFLLKEEKRLINLIDRLKGVRFLKGNRARAQKTLQLVQKELNLRGV